jgi:hypothetical protein
MRPSPNHTDDLGNLIVGNGVCRMITTFPLNKVQRLRKQATKAAEATRDGPERWSKSVRDPMEVLAVFKPLHIKEGYVLRAYQFREGGNGNGFVWAMPIASVFPEPEVCPRLEGTFLEPPKPPAALDDFMEAIDGDGSPWSYLCASLLCRELHEFGAMWHGCQWSTHTILEGNPCTHKPGKRRLSGSSSQDPGTWTWHESEPGQWKPQVAEDGNTITVTFFTYSGLGQESICQISDIFHRGVYLFKTHHKEIAVGTGGYVF